MKISFGIGQTNKPQYFVLKSLWMAGLGVIVLFLAVSLWKLTESWPLRTLADALDGRRASEPNRTVGAMDAAAARVELNAKLRSEISHVGTSGGERQEGVRSLAYLITMSERSEFVAEHSLRLAKFYIWAGGLIALLGLVIFIGTVKLDYFAQLKPSELMNIPHPQVLLMANLAHFFPRVAILIFIEVMAGFFLKQYRTAFEEFRYYEAIARRREAAIAFFLIHQEFKDDKALLEFSQELMRVPTFGVLKEGESTAIIETYKASHNEFLSIITDLVKALKEAVSPPPKAQ
jgi:hypothetical protein